MSYSEKDGQVILTMSREDYATLILALNGLMMWLRIPAKRNIEAFLNRLNQGNPHYTPYQVSK